MKDPITAALAEALRPVLAEVVRDALAEMQSAEQAPALLTVDGICAALQISRGTLHKLRGEGLPELRIGDSPRFELATVIEWLKTTRSTKT